MSKQAYIETELGLLPSDWNIDTLGEMFRPFTSASFSREEMDAQSGVACVHYGDIHKRFGNIVDLDIEKLPLILEEKARAYKLLKDGDLLLADASEDDEGIGKSIVVIVGSHKVIAGLHTIPLRPRKDLDTRFPSYLFAGKLVKRQIEKLSEGTKVNSISFAKIKDVFIPFPPAKEEQSRIASALFDIDTLIRDLDRTIEKKQNIRQGAMEQLLSGKKRLPGFKGEWMTIHFEDIYKFAKEGGTPSTSVPEYYNPGTIPFAKIENLYDHYLTKTGSFISEEGLNHSSAWIVPSGNLLLSNGATLGEVTITAIPAATKQGILGLIIDQTNYSTEYLYYVLKMKDFKRKMEAITTHGTMDCAYLKDLKGIELFVASDIKEQRAIADSLTAMDDEIAMLQLERTKYANIRSGMMDDLLSGTKRL